MSTTPTQFGDTRRAAFTWWNALTPTQRITYAQRHYPARYYITLTGREIEYIHQQETDPKRKKP